MNRDANYGFTLTELMIGIVVSRILPAIALLIYQDHRIKFRTTKTIFADVTVNTTVSESYLSAIITVINSLLVILNAVFTKNKV